MQQNKKSGWRTFLILLGGLSLLALGVCAVLHLERKLVLFCRRVSDRLSLRPVQFETEL